MYPTARKPTGPPIAVSTNEGHSWFRLVMSLGVGASLATLPLLLIADQIQARGLALAAMALSLWVFEAVPAFAPTLLLIVGIPLACAGARDDLRFERILAWCADPVLALFFAGFALAAAVQSHGRIDERLCALALRWSRGGRRALLALSMGATALICMIIPNVSAVPLVFAALVPLLAPLPAGDPYRSALVLGTAMAANIGGMATPIGSGANAIAMASMSEHADLDFLGWTLIAAPITAILLAMMFALLVVTYDVRGTYVAQSSKPPSLTNQGRLALLLAAVVVALWVAGSLHGVPAPIIGLGGVLALALVGLFDRGSLARLDWSTLLLIAGGLMLGRLLEAVGAVEHLATAVDWQALAPSERLAALIGTAAILGALMSNAATAAMLVPLGAAILPGPGTSMLIALGTSLGTLFVISTPANAMACGTLGLTGRHLAIPGAALLLVGGLLLVVLGPTVTGLVPLR